MAWAGYVSVITGVSEFGTIASLHDYGSRSGTPYVPSIPRSVAARHALTMVTDSDPSTHADDVYAELQNYDAGTGSFINYYVPEGYGAVITCRRSPRPTFYKLRKPHASYFDGDVLITTNSETDGSYTPSGGSFMADYYEDLEDANETATQLGHWNVMGDSGLHKMTVNYRDRGDMTVWVDGRLDSGRTPRVELEWTDLDVRKTLTITETNGSWGSVDVEPNQPMYEPNQTITLTAIPIEGKAFSRWEIYDGNYPGDANHAVFDTNDVHVLVMDTDRQVGAAFVCGGSASMLMPLGVVLATLLIVRRRS